MNTCLTNFMQKINSLNQEVIKLITSMRDVQYTNKHKLRNGIILVLLMKDRTKKKKEKEHCKYELWGGTD